MPGIGIGINLALMGGGKAMPAIRLSANSLQENSAQNTAIGTLSVMNATGTAAFTLTDSAGNKVQLAGTNNVNVQAGAVAANYETAQSFTFTVSVSGVTPAISPATFTINVGNVLEVTLAALTLNASNITSGAAEDVVVGALQSVTSGSSLSLVDTAGGRFKLSGANIVAGPTATNFASATSHNITVRETHADGSNSPRDTVIAITVLNDLPAPTLTWTSATSVTTPTFSTVWPDLLFVDDVITMQQAANIGFTGATTYTHTITMDDVINGSFSYGNGPLSDGTYYFRVKATRSSVDITNWSNTETVVISATPAMLRPDGSYILRSDGSRVLRS